MQIKQASIENAVNRLKREIRRDVPESSKITFGQYTVIVSRKCFHVRLDYLLNTEHMPKTAISDYFEPIPTL